MIWKDHMSSAFVMLADVINFSLEEKKMKKMMSLLLVLAMVFGLVACGGNSAPAATEAPTAAATEAPAAEMTEAEKIAAEAEIRYALGLLFDRN